MSGISSGVGLFSGLDTSQLIGQLLAISARPKVLAQQRISQLQVQQSGYLDINSRLQALQTAASSLRTQRIFQTHRATSSDPNVLNAKATTNAREGLHTFIVDRLVSTQQMLSRGFADSNATSIGAAEVVFESAQARLDRDMNLSDLNGGQGVSRGKIVITDSTGASTTVDLSRAGTVSEVLDAINSAAGVQVRASVRDGSFIVEDRAGGSGTLRIVNAAGYTTADSLGIAKDPVSGVITGDRVYGLASSTSLSALNDGNGVFVGNVIGEAAFDFEIRVGGGSAVRVNLGNVYEGTQVVSAAVTTLGGAIDRINSALAAANYDDVSVSIDSTGRRLVLNDALGRTLEVTNRAAALGNTARDLGLETSAPVTGTVTGQRILADLNSTLVTRLHGGSGLSALGDGGLDITLRDGTAFTVNLDLDTSLTDLARQIQNASGTLPGGGPRLSVSLNAAGTGLLISDHTGGTGNLRIVGTSDEDTAVALGISTGPTGVAASTVSGGNLQRQYVSYMTTLTSMNQGRGIGTGVFRITDSFGTARSIDIGTDSITLGDVVREINAAGLRIKARINDNGDGIMLEPTLTGGGVKIKIEDESGSVARNLRIAGEAANTGAENFINGSGEKRVALLASDTLADIMRKINEANAGVSATIINDGNGATPFRLSLSSKFSGSAGRMIVDAGGVDLGLSMLDVGRDARVFYGSSDPARGILLQSSSNTLDRVIEGVTIDLSGVRSDPVTLSIAKDTQTIESKVNELVTAFNDVITRIEFQTRYDRETNQRGPLIGDSTAISLRRTLYDLVISPGLNLTGSFQRLTDIGITIGQGGKLEFDATRFRDAMAQDPEGVEALLTARDIVPPDPVPISPNLPGITVKPTQETFTRLGAAGRLEELTKRFINSIDGVLTERRKSLDEQIAAQRQRITQIDAGLAIKRQRLERQFLAMEQSIAQLQSQQSSLVNIARIR